MVTNSTNPTIEEDLDLIRQGEPTVMAVPVNKIITALVQTFEDEPVYFAQDGEEFDSTTARNVLLRAFDRMIDDVPPYMDTGETLFDLEVVPQAKEYVEQVEHEFGNEIGMIVRRTIEDYFLYLVHR